jgi:hypothetical protein
MAVTVTVVLPFPVVRTDVAVKPFAVGALCRSRELPSVVAPPPVTTVPVGHGAVAVDVALAVADTVTWVMPLPAAGPDGPLGPDGPAGPLGPSGPLGPEGPIGPDGPEAPLGPLGPLTPCGPVTPLSPCGPVTPVSP